MISFQHAMHSAVVASFSVVAVIIVVINYVQLTDPFVGNVLCVLRTSSPPQSIYTSTYSTYFLYIVLCRRS